MRPSHALSSASIFFLVDFIFLILSELYDLVSSSCSISRVSFAESVLSMGVFDMARLFLVFHIAQHVMVTSSRIRVESVCAGVLVPSISVMAVLPLMSPMDGYGMGFLLVLFHSHLVYSQALLWLLCWHPSHRWLIDSSTSRSPCVSHALHHCLSSYPGICFQ